MTHHKYKTQLVDIYSTYKTTNDIDRYERDLSRLEIEIRNEVRRLDYIKSQHDSLGDLLQTVTMELQNVNP